MLRWWWERAGRVLPPDPTPQQLPRRAAELCSRAPADEIRATWIGHSTFLLQVGGRNLLTDPIWSDRASPLQRFGPRRFTPPGLAFSALPELDAVIVSHDHYDHLDDATVRRLLGRWGGALTWFVPLGHAEWFHRRGASAVVELDWWESARSGPLEIRALPAQHWSARSTLDRFRRLWGSWSIRAGGGGSVYFGGDSGWFPAYEEIGARAGPFDLLLMPIGAYEPRWFMKRAHMNPEEAVAAWESLGARGVFGAMHWGTFRLTDEDPLEPPERLLAEWRRRGHPEESLWIAAHGESRTIRVG